MLKYHLKFFSYIIILIFITIIFLSFHFNSQSANESKLMKYFKKENRKMPEQKYILLYSPYFSSKSWSIPMNGSDIVVDFLRQQKCPISNCIITINKTLLESVTDYDAILFPVVTELFEKPESRISNQIYIMGIKEPPSKTAFNFSNVNGFFNWTMTYRLDSDVVWPYSRILDLETQKLALPSNSTYWRVTNARSFHDEYLLEVTGNKTKFAAIFVSHCNAHSKRDDLVKALQIYIDVDIYGKCGLFKCGVTSWGEDEHYGCHKMIEKDYKFYFAFENDLCPDYVTEKLFSTMKYNVVPVVYGGADYSLFVPPLSYINVNDYSTVKNLADYLIYLDQHPLEYIKYFLYKRNYHLVSENFNSFCDLCYKLNDEKSIRTVSIYEDMVDWWGNGSTKCFPKNRNFTNE